MKRGLFIALGILVPALMGSRTPREILAEDHVRVRVSTEPTRQVVIGQQTRFFVEILTDTWFSKAPSYPELGLEGAIALMPEQLGTNFTERIDGKTFAGQRRSYLIFPQRAGHLEIPSLRIRLGVTEDGKAGAPFTISTRPLRLNVVRPAEVEGVRGLVTTPRLRVREEWTPPRGGLNVGDAVQRTVRMDADRALGMLLPKLVFEAPPGIAVYVDPPHILDQVNRGQYRGERVESVTYMLQRPGEFRLPAIDLPWWNSERGVLETETLEARTLEVGRAAGGASHPRPSDPSWPWRERLDSVWAYWWQRKLVLGLIASGALIAMLLVRRSLPAVVTRYRVQCQRRRDSERQLFRRLERSARQGDSDALVSDFWRWHDRLAIDGLRLERGTVGRAARASGFSECWTEFERRRYGADPSPSDPMDLRPALRAYRAALLSANRVQPAGGGVARLNPGAERFDTGFG